MENVSKASKIYTVRNTKWSAFGNSEPRVYTQIGTLEELIEVYSYTLETGASYQHEKGNKKINRNPKNIKSLISNLYNSSNNAARNGCSGCTYSLVEGE